MIKRQDVERLANFHVPQQTAITFYHLPFMHQDLSHRQDAIVFKDLLKEGLQTIKQGGASLKADLERIQHRAEALKDSVEPKAIFACKERGIWEEFDVPHASGATSLRIGRQFHLQPVIPAIENGESICIVLIDRAVNRLLKMQNEKLQEEKFPEQDEEREVRTVGTGDSSKSERRVEHEVAMHFKTLTNHLLFLHERGDFNLLVVGGRDEITPIFTQSLPTPVSQTLLGTFRCDPGAASHTQVKDEVARLTEERRMSERDGLLREITGEAKRNARGAVGLGKVLQSLERGEVHQLVIGSGFKARGTLCPNCNHLDSRLLDHCPACSTHLIEYDDLTDVLIARAYGSKANVVIVDDGEFIGNIGALLRFRADQNTVGKLAS